jgi:hypothetical protein
VPRLLHFIRETHMGLQHEGLVEHMKDRGVDFRKLKPGDMVAFLNRRENMLRVLVALAEKDSFGVVATYRSPHGRVPFEAIKYIPEAFGGGAFNMNAAIKKGLVELLGKKRRGQAAKEEE